MNKPADKISQAELLNEPFPPEMLRHHQSKNLTYVPVSEVIARMNRVLGTGRWGYRINRVWREPDYPNWVIAHVTVTAEVDGNRVAVDGVGGQQVKTLKGKPDPVDLGDEFKGAVSDAFKKACQHLGVGLVLARREDALAVEQDLYAPSETEPVSGGVNDGLWTEFKTQFAALDAQEKAALQQWWTSTFDTPYPSKMTSSDYQIEQTLSELARINLSAAAAS